MKLSPIFLEQEQETGQTSGCRSGTTPAILPAQILDHILRLMNITTEDR